MAFSPITSWQIEGEKVGAVIDFLFLGSKITMDCDCRNEIRRRLLLGRKAMKKLDSVLKSRHHFADKGSYTQGYEFSSSDVRMWDLDNKEGREPKNWCFWTVVLEKTLESPLESKKMKPVNFKEINLAYSLEGLILKLQYFGHIMQTADTLEKTLMLGKTEGRRRRGQQRMRWSDGIIDSLDMNFSKLCKMVRDRYTRYAVVHGGSQIDMTCWLNKISTEG